MFIFNNFSTCFGHHYAHLQENKTYVTACGVLRWFCWLWLVAFVGRWVIGCEHCEGYCYPTTQRPTAATNHNQQNQRSTTHAVTHGLCSPEDGHNDARNMLRQMLIINIWLLHLVGFLSLFTFDNVLAGQVYRTPHDAGTSESGAMLAWRLGGETRRSRPPTRPLQPHFPQHKLNIK